MTSFADRCVDSPVRVHEYPNVAEEPDPKLRDELIGSEYAQTCIHCGTIAPLNFETVEEYRTIESRGALGRAKAAQRRQLRAMGIDTTKGGSYETLEDGRIVRKVGERKLGAVEVKPNG